MLTAASCGLGFAASALWPVIQLKTDLVAGVMRYSSRKGASVGGSNGRVGSWAQDGREGSSILQNRNLHILHTIAQSRVGSARCYWNGSLHPGRGQWIMETDQRVSVGSLSTGARCMSESAVEEVARCHMS